jgi:hypothetical protein
MSGGAGGVFPVGGGGNWGIGAAGMVGGRTVSEVGPWVAVKV